MYFFKVFSIFYPCTEGPLRSIQLRKKGNSIIGCARKGIKMHLSL
jgi:hypothetical protein